MRGLIGQYGLVISALKSDGSKVTGEPPVGSAACTGLGNAVGSDAVGSAAPVADEPAQPVTAIATQAGRVNQRILRFMIIVLSTGVWLTLAGPR